MWAQVPVLAPAPAPAWHNAGHMTVARLAYQELSDPQKAAIAKVLKEEGFVKNFRFIEDGKQGTLRVYLKYGTGGEKIISGLVRVSKPGRRVYVAKDKVPHILGGMGVAILSTSRGVMTDRETRKQQLGGEVLAYVW